MAQARAGVYFCQRPARCVAPVPGGDVGRYRFMVGTCGLGQQNELHLVEFSEDTAEVVCRQALPHDDEVWLLNVSPTDGRLVLTYSAGKSSPALRLWRTGEPEEGQDGSLQLVSSLADDETPLNAVKSALWDPHNEGNTVVADAEAVHVFSGAGASAKLTRLLTLHVGQRCSGACLDPHHPQQVSTVDDTHLKTWDLRASRLAFKRDGAHLFGARDVDYNPNVPYQVLTTGEDSVLRFWDLRNLKNCVQALSGGHHHWIVRARFNSHHDQLVLSCGTDSAVCLWRAGSVASAPLGADSPAATGAAGSSGEAGGEAGGAAASGASARLPDGLIRRFEEHEDSCYSCCWSSMDAWIFASVSYDGKLVVNRVPGEEKYRILL
jgi:WD40 repeat protein